LSIVSVLVVLAGCGGDQNAEQQGSLDATIVDYAAPTNGDALTAAKVRVSVAVAQANSAEVARCLQDRGYPGSEQIPVLQARHEASLVFGNLPSLAGVRTDGVLRTDPSELAQVPSEILSALTECGGSASSRLDEWRLRMDSLQADFLGRVSEAIASTENERVWNDSQSCMVSFGAPVGGVESGSDGPGDYLLWVQSMEVEATGGRAASEAFSTCMGPFYERVAEVLQPSKDAFVGEHEEELRDLQREFSAFDQLN
jgi:hypothetical protein